MFIIQTWFITQTKLLKITSKTLFAKNNFVYLHNTFISTELKTYLL